MLPKAGFAAMVGFQRRKISLMRLKRAEIGNHRCQAFALGKAAGRMAVAFAFGMVERVVDECAAQNGGSQGIFRLQRIGGGRQILIAVAVPGARVALHELGGFIERRPAD